MFRPRPCPPIGSSVRPLPLRCRCCQQPVDTVARVADIGVAASFRFKHLFLCESLVFNVGDDATGWLEFFYPALQPWVHYIPLRDDMEDAEMKLRWAMDHRNQAAVQTIARRGFELIRDHLRNEDVKEYWR